MPRKPKKPCRHPGCPELTEDRYCPAHRKELSREYNKSNRPYQKFYNTTRWQRLRKRFLLEHPLCVECERLGRITPATVVDHIKPHEGNPEMFWDEDNVQSLCKPCHDSKTAREDGRWGKKSVVYTYR